ncbi:MAG: hypothetical protein A2931_04050 [Candidatus Niyogibacteria bacterium RIFCSPLOWO2_01_FULL_45_48]|uniref:Probable endolytic peptidoglycan transglycosylase RlpA n=2 Tax=Candidatus Niyogiibacteriota TaxID=1817912 RepID=A0A1G2EZL0_9BACT|nr:MAG: hypothetical protein A2835_02000 [Candidatus Niyogibacteria bacterium RIFCSPHIGHO2_01_FULL_45_28]OGZ30602.1 MAG: hypothetical protein A2931_04050 [Candidatus Niyogibacteria bacterium RIFCSPLOWO2_01_FULL_45_48]OGZ31274.1 MAG: hypothetical protein A3J00_01585 [Candidatus Niyogibacteria bacterium RIFCSPLOWO2_02_FULL_45_13]
MKAEGAVSHEVSAGQTLWSIARAYGTTVKDVMSINDLHSIIIRPGMTLKVNPGPVLVLASWYGPGFHGRKMANGEVFDMYEDIAAHRVLPLGTMIMVVNPENGRMIVVSVKDRGPYIRGRSLDLSRSAALKIGMAEDGLKKVVIKVLP